MPRDAVSRTANVERTARHQWVILASLRFNGAIIDLQIFNFRAFCEEARNHAPLLPLQDAEGITERYFVIIYLVLEGITGVYFVIIYRYY